MMSDKGESVLTLERLCTALNKTRGSFYHHFTDMDSYVGQLLRYWETKQTAEPIAAANRGQTAKDRLKVLDQAVVKLDHRLDQIVRSWARHDGRAKDALDRVDESRIAYVAELLVNLGYEKRRARLLSELEYTFFLGAQQRFTDLKSSAAKSLMAALRELMVPIEKRATSEGR